MAKQVQIIRGPNDILTKEFLEEKGLNAKNIGFEEANFKLGTIITQNPNPTELQNLIYKVREQSGILIDNTGLNYKKHKIVFPFPNDDELKNESKFKIILTDIPKSYIQGIKKDIQKVMDNYPGFYIEYDLFCQNRDIINKIIYDIIMLNLEKENTSILDNASSFLK